MKHYCPTCKDVYACNNENPNLARQCKPEEDGSPTRGYCSVACLPWRPSDVNELIKDAYRFVS